MQKKQVSHRLFLYGLCGFLLAGLCVSLLRMPQISEDPPHEQQSVRIIDIQVQGGDAVSPTAVLPLANETLSANEEDLDDLFHSPFSVFSDDEGDTGIAIPAPEKSKIVIIIDDVGINHVWSRKAAELPAPITLSFLPYAEHLQDQVDFASAQGHQLMLHMPMEAMNGVMRQTPGLLLHTDSPHQFENKFYNNLNSFSGFTGINNHMGSLLTQDEASMHRVMMALKSKGLYFIDSRTIADSLAADVARDVNVPVLVRDIFLDHEETPEYTAAALQELEALALQKGSAIAIGHPKEITITALAAWLPTLAEKNIEVISADDLIQQFYPGLMITAYKADLSTFDGHLTPSKPVLSSVNYQIDHTIDQEVAD